MLNVNSAHNIAKTSQMSGAQFWENVIPKRTINNLTQGLKRTVQSLIARYTKNPNMTPDDMFHMITSTGANPKDIVNELANDSTISGDPKLKHLVTQLQQRINSTPTTPTVADNQSECILKVNSATSLIRNAQTTPVVPNKYNQRGPGGRFVKKPQPQAPVQQQPQQQPLNVNIPSSPVAPAAAPTSAPVSQNPYVSDPEGNNISLAPAEIDINPQVSKQPVTNIGYGPYNVKDPAPVKKTTAPWITEKNPTPASAPASSPATQPAQAATPAMPTRPVDPNTGLYTDGPQYDPQGLQNAMNLYNNVGKWVKQYLPQIADQVNGPLEKYIKDQQALAPNAQPQQNTPSGMEGLGYELGRNIKEPARAVGNAFKDVGQQAWRGMKNLGKGIGQGVRNFGRGFRNANDYTLTVKSASIYVNSL